MSAVPILLQPIMVLPSAIQPMLFEVPRSFQIKQFGLLLFQLKLVVVLLSWGVEGQIIKFLKVVVNCLHQFLLRQSFHQ